MFFFQTMFQQVLSGINGSSTLNSVTTIAQGILLLCALFAVYEAYSRGGDARSLALAGVRFLFMGLVLTQYQTVFGAVNNAANSLANQIAPNDVFTNWRTQLVNYWQTYTTGSSYAHGHWWNAIVGGFAGVLSLAFQTIAALLFPITYAIFSFFYSMYGAMLYVVGPLVLALYPAFGIGQIARTYMVNFLIWNAWGILYAVLSQMLTLMNAGTLSSVLSQGTFAGLFSGASQELLIALSSILFSLMIALIPFIAKRVVSGDVGTTMFTVIGAATTALAAVGAGVAAIGGAMAGGGGGPGGPGGGGPGGGGGAGGAAASSGTAPTPPEASGGGSNGGVVASSQTGGGGKGAAGGGGGGGRRQSTGRNSGGQGSEGYPIGLGPQNVFQLGMSGAPAAMVGWAIGKTARAVSNRFKSSSSSSKEEA
jgi:hypothetical protein